MKRSPQPKSRRAAPRARTGGRSARVVDQVLTATVELVGRSGYGELRVEQIAERSGVNKTTIYRRWPTKGALVAAALRQHYKIVPADDTGDLERDLVHMFESTLRKHDSQITRGVLRMFQTERGDPEVDSIVRELRDRSVEIRRTRLDAAVKRGELPKKTDVSFLLQLLSTAIHSRAITFNEPVTHDYMIEVIRIILAGARIRYR